MQRESKGYALIVGLFCILGLLIYGAYSPARKAQKQQIFCFSFTDEANPKAVDKHMRDFAALRHDIPQVVGYTAGKTFLVGKADSEYDVMHYLTFQNEEDMKAFEQNPAYKKFVDENKDSWDKTLVVNAEIQP
ncbi:Dabb family protein [Fibrivirga algicola]|uniref:Dabb family protein n=1 Tax=Fibrivirga algicola TaxID=2950420 RepID=A0ABX0QM67_9BACT|nr:Dabb family protein [Fibrivirga algicola]ARK11324.1 stress protein [Fibrella sp. ES10-3-2-2]NID13201.1 Dabb family protein [Fibrivirga algicola]